MKRNIYKGLLFGIIGTLLISVSALAATWQFNFPINITDTSNVTRTYYPVMTGLNGQTFIDGSKIDSDGLDTNMQVGTSSIKYMVSTDNISCVLPILPGGGSLDASFYTGYSPEQSSFALVFGEGGYGTIADDASLELGDNFTATLSGVYLDTDNGTDKHIFNKQDALKIYVDNVTSGTINALMNWGSQGYISPTGTDDPVGAWTDDALAKDGNLVTYAYDSSVAPSGWSEFLYFTVPSTYITGMRVYNSSSPIFSQVDMDYYDGSWHDMYQGALPNNDWAVGTFSGAYATQARVRIFNGSAGITAMYMYEVQLYQDYEYLGLSVQDITNGEYDIILSADTSNVTLSVGTTANTTSQGSATVLNNTSNIILFENNSAVYCDNVTIDIDGVQQAWYEPNTMLSGATVPDRAGDDNPMTITWGTNSDITVHYGAMVSSGYTEAPESVDTGFEMDSTSMPVHWFNSSADLSGLPFYDHFNQVATESGQSVVMYYFWIAMGMAWMAFMTLAIYTRSVLVALVGMILVLTVFSMQGVVAGWLVFSIAVIDIFIAFLYKKVATS